MSGQSPQSRIGAKMMPMVSKRVFPPEWIEAGDDRTQLRAIAKKRRALDGPRPPLSAWGRATTTIAGRPLHLFTPKTGSTGWVLFYCHGGAFVVGPSTLEWSHAAKFASAIGCDLALFDYPKVPEHDSADMRATTLTAYHLIAERYGDNNMAIAGLSAGGGLAVSTMLQLHRNGHTLPNAAALFSPWLDMTVAHPDAAAIDSDMLLPIEVLRRDGALYAGSMELTNPLVSPRFTTAQELAALPATVVTAGEQELLLPEGNEFVDHLNAAGTTATMHLEHFGQHAGIIASTPEASELFTAAATQMRQHLDT